MPLFRVVLLQSASSLTRYSLRGEYLVVGLTIHELLEVAQCCSTSARATRPRSWGTGGPGSSPADVMNCVIGRLGLFGVWLSSSSKYLSAVSRYRRRFHPHAMGYFLVGLSDIICLSDASLPSYRPRETSRY